MVKKVVEEGEEVVVLVGELLEEEEALMAEAVELCPGELQSSVPFSSHVPHSKLFKLDFP